MPATSPSPEFTVRPGGPSLDRSFLFRLINRHWQYLTKEFHTDISQEIFDRVHGDSADFEKNLLVFESQGRQIVGYCIVSNMSGDWQTWWLIYAIDPAFIQGPLPQLMIENAVKLIRARGLSRVETSTIGPFAEPFDRILQDLGYKPQSFLLEMQLKTNHPPTGTHAFTTLEIRQAERMDDMESYVQLMNAAFTSLYGYEVKEAESERDIFKFRGHQYQFQFFTVWHNGELIGLCTTEYDPENDLGYIESLAVRPGHQHQGIGRALLQEGLTYLQNIPCGDIRITVIYDNNNALKLYEGVGFVPIGLMRRTFYNIR